MTKNRIQSNDGTVITGGPDETIRDHDGNAIIGGGDWQDACVVSHSAVVDGYSNTVSGDYSTVCGCFNVTVKSERTMAIYCHDIVIDAPRSFWVNNKRVTVDEARRALHRWQEDQRLSIETAARGLQHVLHGRFSEPS